MRRAASAAAGLLAAVLGGGEARADGPAGTGERPSGDGGVTRVGGFGVQAPAPVDGGAPAAGDDEPVADPAWEDDDWGAPADLPGMETVVRAAAPPRTASERRIGEDELRAAPHRSTDDLLRLVPGLLVVQHGAEGKGHQFFLRGFDAAHGTDVELLVEGLPVNGVSNVHGHGYLDLYFLPPEIVESMLVEKGPFDLGQGDFATAGTVRLELGVPEADRGGRLSYESGLTNRHRVLALWSAEAGRDDFAVSELVFDDGFGSDRWTRRWSVLGRLDGDRLGGGPDLILGLHAGRFGSPNAVRLEDWREGRFGFLDTYTHGLEGSSSHALALASERFDAGGGELRATAGVLLTRFALESNYTGWLHEPDEGDFRRQRHDSLEGFASAWWTRDFRLLDRPFVVRAGAEWRGDWFAQDEAMIRMTSRESWRTDRDASGQVHHATLAAGVTWSPLWWLQLDAGVRGDLFGIVYGDRRPGHREHDDVLGAAAPRLSLRFPVADDWTLFASYGRGLRSPEARSVAAGEAPAEDAPLDAYRGGEPEVAVCDAVEAGLRFALDDWLEVSAAGFATLLDNETVFDHVSSTNLELNATRRVGGELAVRVRPLSWLEIHADLTGVDARFAESGNPVPGAPVLLASFGVSVAHPLGFRAALSGFYMAPRPLAHGAQGSHQFVLDATAAYRWRWVEVEVQVENLTATDWLEGEYHFASWFDRDAPRSAIPVTHYTAGTPLDVRLGVTFRF